MDMLSYAGVPIVLLLIGISELMKRSGVNPKIIPFINLALGVVAGMLITPDDFLKGVIIGIATGLSSVGLYSGVKNTIEGMK
jgi:hypothetical protein